MPSVLILISNEIVNLVYISRLKLNIFKVVKDLYEIRAMQSHSKERVISQGSVSTKWQVRGRPLRERRKPRRHNRDG